MEQWEEYIVGAMSGCCSIYDGRGERKGQWEGH